MCVEVREGEVFEIVLPREQMIYLGERFAREGLGVGRNYACVYSLLWFLVFILKITFAYLALK